MKKSVLLISLSIYVVGSLSANDRNILQTNAQEIGIEDVLIKDFSEIDFPTYYDREFWDTVADPVRKQYIHKAVEFLVSLHNTNLKGFH